MRFGFVQKGSETVSGEAVNPQHGMSTLQALRNKLCCYVVKFNYSKNSVRTEVTKAKKQRNEETEKTRQAEKRADEEMK